MNGPEPQESNESDDATQKDNDPNNQTVAYPTDYVPNAPTPYSSRPSERISERIFAGKYRMIKEIGHGGMGRVFQVETIQFQDHQMQFALKVLQQNSPNYKKRFEREYISVSKLTHPHIIMVREFGFLSSSELPKFNRELHGFTGLVDARIPYILMDFCPGVSLERILQDTLHPWQCDLKRSIDLIRQILDGISYAHQNKIIHRDLKPANVLVMQKDEGEVIKIIDFGLAKILAESEDVTTLTQTGQLPCTPQYASYEQLAGDKHQIDHRTDIYSMGVILYQMCTGQLPWPKATWLEQLARIANPKPPPLPRSINNAIPKDVEIIILKALAEKSEDRFQTANEFKQALEECSLHTSHSFSVLEVRQQMEQLRRELNQTNREAQQLRDQKIATERKLWDIRQQLQQMEQKLAESEQARQHLQTELEKTQQQAKQLQSDANSLQVNPTQLAEAKHTIQKDQPHLPPTNKTSHEAQSQRMEEDKTTQVTQPQLYPSDIRSSLISPLLEDSYVHQIQALVNIGPTAVPALISSVNHQAVEVRRCATLALGKIGPDAKSAVTALINSLKDQDNAVRQNAATTLGKIGPNAKSAVPALIHALQDQDNEVRQNAATALGKIGPAAKSATEALILTLKDQYVPAHLGHWVK